MKKIREAEKHWVSIYEVFTTGSDIINNTRSIYYDSYSCFCNSSSVPAPVKYVLTELIGSFSLDLKFKFLAI